MDRPKLITNNEEIIELLTKRDELCYAMIEAEEDEFNELEQELEVIENTINFLTEREENEVQ